MRKSLIYSVIGLGLAACGNSVTTPELVDQWPEIYPDYVEVTIPATIAPMNFNYVGGEIGRAHV